LNNYIPFTRIPTPFHLCFQRSQKELERVRVEKYGYTNKAVIRQIREHFPLNSEFGLRDAYYWHVKNKETYKVDDEVLFFACTTNQFDSISGIAKHLGIDHYISDTENITPAGQVIIRNLAKVYGLLYLPYLLTQYWLSRGFQRINLRGFFHIYLSAYGSFHYYRKLFRKNKKKVKLAVVANDHSFRSRAFFLAAQAEGIPTAYVQHAAASLEFPALEFSYAFLDGHDALNKYAQIGPSSSTCFLTGISKLDEMISQAKSTHEQDKIGICINVFDDTSRLTDLIKALCKQIAPSRLLFRPHPSVKKETLRSIDSGIPHKLEYSIKESVSSFLLKVDVIISSESGILLESPLLGVPAIYFKASDLGDLYGFHANGLITHAFEDVKPLVNYISEKAYRDQEIPKRVIQHYCASKHTSFEGRTTELIASCIKTICQGDHPKNNKKIWRACYDVTQLEAYEIVNSGMAENKPHIT